MNKQTNKNIQVVGGRRTHAGRLGAFVTRVKRGSVADTIGRLRPGLCILFYDIYCFLILKTKNKNFNFTGDEVLEWNGRSLQNATFEQVYEIISDSKHDSQVELIVSRSTA
jgi:regulating synaptic membrane exocytosis protein 2